MHFDYSVPHSNSSAVPKDTINVNCNLIIVTNYVNCRLIIVTKAICVNCSFMTAMNARCRNIRMTLVKNVDYVSFLNIVI